MKNLIVATMAAIFLAGCAVHAGVGSRHHGVEVGAGVYIYDKDRGQHYYTEPDGRRHYMEKGWKKPD